MSIARAAEAQAAIFAQLTAALSTAAPGGGALAIYDHVPDDTAEPHARLEVFGFEPLAGSKDAPVMVRHRFSVRVFDDPGAGASGSRGQGFVKGVAALVVAALEEWRPVSGAGRMRHLATTISPDESGAAFEASSRFEFYL